MVHFGMIKHGRPIAGDVAARLVQLVDALSRDDRVAAVWLFGSRARGEADALSDVDLAVLASDRLDTPARWKAELEWIELATRILATDEVGIQVLNGMPVGLRDPILRDARLLWARSPEAAADFAATTLKAYLDFKPYLDRYDTGLLREAAAGRLR
jgi:predicted nucleotidyltransferase